MVLTLDYLKKYEDQFITSCRKMNELNKVNNTRVGNILYQWLSYQHPSKMRAAGWTDAGEDGEWCTFLGQGTLKKFYTNKKLTSMLQCEMGCIYNDSNGQLIQILSPDQMDEYCYNVIENNSNVTDIATALVADTSGTNIHLTKKTTLHVSGLIMHSHIATNVATEWDDTYWDPWYESTQIAKDNNLEAALILGRERFEPLRALV